jgi:hypothetical protein
MVRRMEARLSIKKREGSVRNKKEKNPSLYDKDFYKWLQTQASFLKKGQFEKLDLENLVEEIESLGRTERRIVESHLTILLMHMLKKQYQPEKYTKSWESSIKNARQRLKKALNENPSLKPKLGEILKDAYFSARLDASDETGVEAKTFPKTCPWTLNEIL